MLNDETIRRLKSAFRDLQAPLGTASLEDGFLTNNVSFSNAVDVAKRAFQEIPKGIKNYIPLANGIPGDMDRLLEEIDKIQWYVDNKKTPSHCSLTQYFDETKQLLERIVKRIP